MANAAAQYAGLWLCCYAVLATRLAVDVLGIVVAAHSSATAARVSVCFTGARTGLPYR